MQVDVQDREDEPEIGGDRRLAREQELDSLLDAHIALVDVVVEGDHLVCELVVPLLERIDGAAERAQHERAFLLQRRLELVELLLERRPHPKRPVT